VGKAALEQQVELPRLHAAEQLVLDYGRKGLSVNDHPLRHHRKRLDKLGAIRAADLFYLPRGTKVSLAGLVMARQRPATASGVVFITLEDETGSANLIVYSSIFEGYHHVAKNAQLLFVSGEIERDEKLPVAQRGGETGTERRQGAGQKKRAPSEDAPVPVIHVIVKHIERWANNSGPDVRAKSRDFH
jgi:DNA polymerase III alpha subunit